MPSENEGITAMTTVDDVRLDVLAKNSQAIIERAKHLSVSISDQASFDEACRFRIEMNGFKKAALADIAEIKKPAWDTYQAVLKKEREIIAPFDEAMRMIDDPIGDWWDKQERKRKEEEERLAAKAKKEREDAAIEAARNADLAGNHAKAASILAHALDAPAPAVKLPKTQTTQGVSFSKIYSIKEETIDLPKLIAGVVSGEIETFVLQPNIQYLKAQARAKKERFNYPGVELLIINNPSSRKI